MNNLYEALEICLQDLEKGADLESVLFRYPEIADDLRPILEASTGAKSMAVSAPSPEVVRRNRAKVLQQAAQMRESNVKSSQRLWFASLRRIAVTLAVVTVLFVSGTSLVGASSNTLPGDNLYPVKRTWEGLRLFFTFNPMEREALELEHENERLHEVQELLAEGRSAEADFNGFVMSQKGNEWVVGGVRVLISSQTEIRDGGIMVGSPVRVRGITQENGTVLAERIRLLSDDAKVPGSEKRHDSENGNEDNSGPGSGDDRPSVEESDNANDNSGNGNDSGPDDNQNDNSNENDNTNDNSGSGKDGSGGDDNSGSGDSSGGNDNSSNDNSNANNNDSSGGGNDQGNDNGGDDGQNNDNGDDSGGGDNSGSGSDDGGGGED